MYFFQSGVERTFGTFDLTHLGVLLTVGILFFFFFKYRDKYADLKRKDLYGYIFGGVLLFLDFSFYVWKWRNGNQPHFPIPMHICSWATYLVALSMFTKNETLFQISFFYGLTGGLMSLLVPEFGGYSFDHMRFYQFFMLHTMIILGPLYQLFAYKRKVNYRFIYITLGVMWIQAAIAFPVNRFVEQWTGQRENMMFVFEPPVPLPGFLGQSPVYLIVFTFVFMGLWHGYYYLFNSKKVQG